MNSLNQKLSQIIERYKELQVLKPFTNEDEERLWRKFRLEWNYNSNHIEGNTLTYGQTKLLLMFDKTTGDHEMREYEEMKAHDAAIELVRRYSTEKERDLTEADIREWNKIILVRPYWKEAITQDGQPTKKLVEPGQYKKTHNSVRLINGELFHYASPEETPSLMNELMRWYRDEEVKGELHAVEVAALLHYKFVRIHPFDDSNGRTARLIMNYVLMKHGYPPVIIKSVDKKNYLFALNKADSGDLNAFVEYVADQLDWSLTLAIKAAKGESVDEGGDVYKKIELLKRDIKTQEIPKQRLVQTIKELYQNSIRKLFVSFLEKFEIFDEIFRVKHFSVGLNQRQAVNAIRRNTLMSFLDKSFDDRLRLIQKNDDSVQEKFFIKISFEKLKSKSSFKADAFLAVSIVLDHYSVEFNGVSLLKKPCSNHLSDEEINGLVEECVEVTYLEVESSKLKNS